MQLDLITSREGLEAVGGEWEELETRSRGHLFQSHRFLTTWYACAGRENGAVPAVVTAREQGTLCGVFPACIVTKGGVRILTWLGGFFIVDYGDVIFDQGSSCRIDEFLDGALQLLRRETRFHISYFHNMRHDAAAYPYFKGHFKVFRPDVAPYVELAGSFEGYLDSLKRFRKKQKSDTLRQIKRLGELGGLEFRVVSGDDAEAVLDAFLEQKRWRFDSSGVHGVLFKPGYEEFYREQVRHGGSVHLSCLTLDGRIIATHLGYLYRNRLYFVMPTYDHQFSRYSPGRVLTYYLIQDCFENGVDLFDFCIGSEEYKYEWTDRDVPITSFVSEGLSGSLFIALKKGKIRCTRLLNRIKGVKG